MYYSIHKEQHEGFIAAVWQFSRLHPQILFENSLTSKSELLQQLQQSRNYIYRHFYLVAVDGLFLLAFLTLIGLLSGELLLAILMVLMAFTVIALFLKRNIIAQFQRRKHSDETRLTGIADFLFSLAAAKMQAHEFRLWQRYEVVERKAVSHTYDLAFKLSLIDHLSYFTSQLLLLVTLLVGAEAIQNEHLTFGALIAVLMITGRLINPIREILLLWFHHANYCNLRTLNPSFTQNRPYLKGTLCFKHDYLLDMDNVTVKDHHELILSSLNIKIKKGQCLAITNISLKQQLAFKKLLTGISSPTEGAVYASGNPIHHLSSEQFCHFVAYISLEEHFITGTILDNMTGFRDLPDETIEELCALFSIKEELFHLEHSFQSQIHPNSVAELSSTLRMKILLMRAYINKPKLIVIDIDSHDFAVEAYTVLFKFIKNIRLQSAILILSNEANLIRIADSCYDFSTARYQDFEISHF